MTIHPLRLIPSLYIGHHNTSRSDNNITKRMRSMGSFSFFWKVESDDSILKHKKILFPQFKNPERETHASLLAIINVFLFLKRAGYSKGFFAEHTKPTFVDIRRTHSLIPMLFAQSGLWTCAFQGRCVERPLLCSTQRNDSPFTFAVCENSIRIKCEEHIIFLTFGMLAGSKEIL